MRVIHLCFQLQLPEKRQSDKTEREVFDKFNRDVVQPFLALLERNIQRYEKLHLSLLLTGEVWEQAEQFDPEIMARLKKMVSSGNVELIVTPFYQTWSFYYNQEEFLDQVSLCQEKIYKEFGMDNPVLASTELDYNDELAVWAEKHGFAVMLARLPQSELGWYSANHVYEASGCEYLRVLFENERITELLRHADTELLARAKDAEQSESSSLSLARFRKSLDLEWLRGSLMNIFLDAEIFARLREVGISSFFDEMFRVFQKDLSYRFVNASEACVFETPLMLTKIKSASTNTDSADALCETTKVGLPDWLGGKTRIELIERLKKVRAEVWRRGDRELKMAYHRLEKASALKENDGKDLALALDDLMALLPAIEQKSVSSTKVNLDTKAQKDNSQSEMRTEKSSLSRKAKADQKTITKDEREGVVAVHFKKKTHPQREESKQKKEQVDALDGVVEVHFLKKTVKKPDDTVAPLTDEGAVKINFVKKNSHPQRESVQEMVVARNVGDQFEEPEKDVAKMDESLLRWTDNSESDGTKEETSEIDQVEGRIRETYDIPSRERLERELMANVRAELEEEIVLQEQAQRAHRDRIVHCVEKAEEAQIVVPVAPKNVEDSVPKVARTSLRRKIIRRSLVIE